MHDMTIKEAQQFLAETYGVTISTRSIHSWVSVGVKGVKLVPTLVRNVQQTHKDKYVRRFSEQALENFAVAIGLRERV
jgi:uncharacterized radical SAM superfamily Fe-S cluster-containing enzyme